MSAAHRQHVTAAGGGDAQRLSPRAQRPAVDRLADVGIGGVLNVGRGEVTGYEGVSKVSHGLGMGRSMGGAGVGGCRARVAPDPAARACHTATPWLPFCPL